MQPNTLAAPRRLMHDVTPPYAMAADSRPTQVRPASQESVAAPVIPVAQPAAPAQPQPPAIPVHEQPAPVSAVQPAPAPTAVNHHTQQVPVPKASPQRAKTNWLVIVLAVLVAVGLAAAAFYAYKPS